MAWAERKRPPQTRTGVRGSTEWRQKPRHGSFPQSPVASPSLLSAAAPPSSLLALGARSALAAPCFLLRGGLRREATGAVWAGLHSAFQTRPSLPPLPRPAHSLPSTPPTTHRAAWSKGQLTFCGLCGCWAEFQPRDLRTECQVVSHGPSALTANNALGRLRQGKPPKKTWPDWGSTGEVLIEL